MDAAVGATWGPGVRRAPSVPSWGFNQAVVAKIQTPYLAVSGGLDIAPFMGSLSTYARAGIGGEQFSIRQKRERLNFAEIANGRAA